MLAVRKVPRGLEAVQGTHLDSGNSAWRLSYQPGALDEVRCSIMGDKDQYKANISRLR